MSNEKTLIRDYTSGPVARQLLSFSGPFMLSNLLTSAYNIVDMMVVGRFVGAAGLSAVSVGTEIIHLFTFITMGFCNAGQVIISQYVGGKDRESLSKIFGTLFSFVLFLSLILTAVGLLGRNLWMRLMNVPAEALVLCRQYTVCCTSGMLFLCGYILVSAILRGMGDSKRPMIFIAVASVLNVVLDLILVSAGLGAFGAALATVIAQGVSFLLSLLFLWKNRRNLGFRFRRRMFIPDPSQLWLLMKMGIPMTIQTCAINISSLFIISRINTYGVTASAVTGVGQKLCTLASIITLALHQAGATMVGQNFAARQFDRVQKILGLALAIGLAFTAMLSAAIVLWPEQIFAMFNDDPAVLVMCHDYVPIAVLNLLAFACRSPSFALCNGIGFPALNFVLGIFDGVILRIGLGVMLGDWLGMGIRGYWLGAAIAGYAFFIGMLPYYLSGMWKRHRPITMTQANAAGFGE
ncbi:MAG: MATE family efflux transporter [Oscillospiraceae bacterium]|nr:MATE family efflux transporter [Oscillospiraceae bacterium]